MFTSYYTAENNAVFGGHLRYEHKFFISHFTEYEMEEILKFHPAIFSEIYYGRSVNNIYLDTFNRNSYFDNLSGRDKRIKVRIRWYGDLLGYIENPILELKIKEGLVCRKKSFPLDGFSLDGHFSKDELFSIFKTSQIPDVLKLDLGCLDFSLLNTYRRKYYLSRDGRYRITLDSGLEFYEMGHFKNRFLNKSADHISNILEVKYDRDYNEGVNKITSCLPFRMTRSSKYIMGLERINLMRTYSYA